MLLLQLRNWPAPTRVEATLPRLSEGEIEEAAFVGKYLKLADIALRPSTLAARKRAS